MNRAQTSSPVTLEDLAALNDEICALSRARMPLELGLSSTGTGLTRQIAELADSLATQLSQGVSLDDALSHHSGSIPPVYRAMVTAGVKTGRLDTAIESLSGFSRSLESLRQRIGIALLYPALVVMIAWALWATFLLTLFPTYDGALRDFGADGGSFQNAMRFTANTWLIWIPIIPLVVLGIGSAWWLSRKWLLQPSEATVGWHPGRVSAELIRRLPWIGSILKHFHRANFTELLGMMLAHNVPLSHAVPVAIDASGDSQLIRTRDQIIAGIEAGRPLGETLQLHDASTPFVRWMINSAERQEALPETLRQATTILRRRAAYQVEWFQLTFPVLLLAVVGGGAVLIYSLSLFIPVVNLLDTLSLP